MVVGRYNAASDERRDARRKRVAAFDLVGISPAPYGPLKLTVRPGLYIDLHCLGEYISQKLIRLEMVAPFRSV